MATSLARRIRRIGILPTLSVSEVMDSNHITKLANARARVAEENSSPDSVAYLKEVEDAITAELAPHTKQHLSLTTEQITEATAHLKAAAKARRVAAKKLRRAQGKQGTSVTQGKKKAA